MILFRLNIYMVKARNIMIDFQMYESIHLPQVAVNTDVHWMNVS